MSSFPPFLFLSFFALSSLDAGWYVEKVVVMETSPDDAGDGKEEDAEENTVTFPCGRYARSRMSWLILSILYV